MRSETFKYLSFDETREVEETFYFHLDLGDLADLEMEFDADVSEFLTAAVESNNRRRLISSMETVLSRAIGRKSEDGTRFHKTPEVWADFKASPCWSLLLERLAEEEGYAPALMSGMMPKRLTDRAKKVEK